MSKLDALYRPTRLARALDAAIARNNARTPVTPRPLCGTKGCPLPAGHDERVGSAHLPPIVTESR